MYNNHNDELTHYGVLGMKWGQRRAAKRGDSYKYTSWNTNRHKKASVKLASKAQKAKSGSKKQTKLQAKSDNRARKAAASQKYDDLQSSYAKNTAKAGRTVLANVLTYPGLVNSYQRMRATGSSKAKAIAASYLFGDLAGRVNKHNYIKRNSK